MTFFCIADPDSSLGFKFAGVETREAHTRPEAEEALRVGLAMQGVGVILVTGKIADFLRAEIESRIYTPQLPLILEVPSRGEASRQRKAGELLKKAIGISV